MPRPRPNPFYAILGIVGFLFTITASSYCLFVLRGVRRESLSTAPHALEQLMDRHGITLLVGQIAVLAVATVGAVAIDHFEGERQKRDREQASAAKRSRDSDAAGTERP
jgi:Tfp pilus assembly protein PilE